MPLTDGVWVTPDTMIEQLVFAIPAIPVTVVSAHVSLVRHTRSLSDSRMCACDSNERC
jgi:hypothetical protein